MISIEKEKVKKVFHEYTDHYDLTDDKVRLKVEHTYRVADLCERIAAAEKMSEYEQKLAWLLGMLHDVGRFEQLRRFHTFVDAQSVDHAALGADILFHEGHIRDYVQEADEDTLIETAVRWHSAYRLPEDLDYRTDNPVTRRQFAGMKEEMERFLQSKS